MTLEAGKEMDKKCVLDWLNKVYISPSVTYSQYTDDEIRIFAHDALVLLKEQEAVEPKVEKEILDYQSWHYICGNCGGQIDINDNYCRHCGRVVAHLSNKI